MMLGKAAELFVALVPVHLLDQHPIWLLRADYPSGTLGRYLSKAQGRTNSGLNRTSQRRRGSFQGLYRISMGQEDFTLLNPLVIHIKVHPIPGFLHIQHCFIISQYGPTECWHHQHLWLLFRCQHS